MDERPDGSEQLPDGQTPDEADSSTAPARPVRQPEGPAAEALAEEAAEIRRMVEAGAGSPEAIRELAQRLRDHRAREEALWRAEVRPVLKQEGKGRLRGHRKASAPGEPTSAAPAPAAAGSQALTVGAVMLALVAIVVIAANTSVWVLLLPVIALLAWAWVQGKDDVT